MRATSLLLVIVAAATPLSTVAAQEQNGASGLTRGDFAAAEREIAQQRRFAPNDVDLLANLASVYRHTNRDGDARALYRQILALPDEPLDLPRRRTIGSHALANGALARLDRTIAAR